MEHQVRLRETMTGNSLLDMAEDAIAEMIEHSCNPLTETKPNSVSIKITLLPNENRDQFVIDISRSMRLASKRHVSLTLFGGVGANGSEAVEYNPRQLAMFGTAVTPEGDKS